MLPALKTDRPRLADVLASSLASIAGDDNILGLPMVRKAIVVLVDGLGAAALQSRAGHARTLAGRLGPASIIESGFPTTTAAALASLATGLPAGQHGLVGYSVLDEANDRVVNQLSGWDTLIDPIEWQSQPTIFEKAAARGFDAVVIGPARYKGSGFSTAVLRGARYLPAATIAERFQVAESWAREPGNGIAYLYIPELDQTGHASGWQSPAWTDWLEQVDSAVRAVEPVLGKGTGLIVTADHGVIDVPASSHVLVDELPGLLDGVRFVAGEPRCLQLHFDTALDAAAREALVAEWHASEDSRSWVATRAEAISAGWFGVVDPAVESRIGDLIVAARKDIAYYDGRAKNQSGRKMIGQHGSWSPAELRIPLLRFGAFAR